MEKVYRTGDRRVRRFIALGIALPVVICAVAYGTAWITGLTTFRPDGAAADATTATRLIVFATSGAVMVSISTLAQGHPWTRRLGVTACPGIDLGAAWRRLCSPRAATRHRSRAVGLRLWR